MSGGVAYVLDEDNDLYTRTNKEMVFTEEFDQQIRCTGIKRTDSGTCRFDQFRKRKEILDNFGEYLPKFKKGSAI